MYNLPFLIFCFEILLILVLFCNYKTSQFKTAQGRPNSKSDPNINDFKSKINLSTTQYVFNASIILFYLIQIYLGCAIKRGSIFDVIA